MPGECDDIDEAGQLPESHLVIRFSSVYGGFTARDEDFQCRAITTFYYFTDRLLTMVPRGATCKMIQEIEL